MVIKELKEINHSRLLMKNIKSIWCCETVKLCLLYTAKDPRLRLLKEFTIQNNRSMLTTNHRWTNVIY